MWEEGISWRGYVMEGKGKTIIKKRWCAVALLLTLSLMAMVHSLQAAYSPL
jgi:hypothetical protein